MLVLLTELLLCLLLGPHIHAIINNALSAGDSSSTTTRAMAVSTVMATTVTTITDTTTSTCNATIKTTTSSYVTFTVISCYCY